MSDDAALTHLFEAYLNQDVFDLYADEFAGAADFAADDPRRARQAAIEIDELLSRSSDDELRFELDRMGVEIRPVDRSYRDWLTEIAGCLRTAG